MDNMTAKVSCFARAYHYNNNSIRIFTDDIAEKLLGEDYNQIAKSMSDGIDFFCPGFEGTREEGLRLILDRQLSPSVLGRSVFCESKFFSERRIWYLLLRRTILSMQLTSKILAIIL